MSQPSTVHTPAAAIPASALPAAREVVSPWTTSMSAAISAACTAWNCSSRNSRIPYARSSAASARSVMRYSSTHRRRCREMRRSRLAYRIRAERTDAHPSGAAARSISGTRTGCTSSSATIAETTPTSPDSRSTAAPTSSPAASVPRARTRCTSSANPGSSNAAASTCVVSRTSCSSAAARTLGWSRAWAQPEAVLRADRSASAVATSSRAGSADRTRSTVGPAVSSAAATLDVASTPSAVKMPVVAVRMTASAVSRGDACQPSRPARESRAGSRRSIARNDVPVTASEWPNQLGTDSGAVADRTGSAASGTAGSVRVQRLDDRGVGGEDAAALEFHRRGELRGVGQPLVRQDRDLLDALDLGDPAVDLRHAAFQLGPDLRGGGELGEPGRQALPGGPARRDLGVEHEQRDQVAPPVADHARLADQRQRLEHRLQVRRGHVLAARGDDQLLLAVDDRQVAVVVEPADVAGVQPAVGVEGLRAALRVVQVAGRHDRAAGEHLAA